MRPKRSLILASLVLLIAACHGDRARDPALQVSVTAPEGGVAAPVLAVEARAPVSPHVPAFPDAALVDAVVDQTRDRVLAERAARSAAPAGAAVKWDHHTPPRYLDRVVERVGLTGKERALLEKNGFVGLGLTFGSWGEAFDFIHRRELPLYVSADALLYSVFRSHSDLLETVEIDNERRLTAILKKLHEELPRARRSYAPEVAADADLYLAVARNLIEKRGPMLGQPAIRSVLGRGDLASPLIERIFRAKGPLKASLFGRERVIDREAFMARGFYTKDLDFYWAAVAWLSRIELNLVSRGARAGSPKRQDAGETPREATLALALADLASRSGALADLKAFDARLRAFAGPREDVTPAELGELGRGLDLRDPKRASEELTARIGDRFKRTAPTEAVEDPSQLPTVATLLGVGIPPEVASLAKLAHRRELRAADVAWALGHDAAREHVTGADPEALAASRKAMTEARRGPDAYASWLSSVRALAEPTTGRTPSFFGTPAHAEERMASSVAAFGAIRNVYALITPIVFRTGSCTIPDAYVEPLGPFLEALESYGKTIEPLAASLEEAAALEDAMVAKVDADYERYRKATPATTPEEIRGLKRAQWFSDSHRYMNGSVRAVMSQPARFTKTIAALRAIAEDERAGRPLSEAQLGFLGMVSEFHHFNMYDEERTPPRYNGWYPRLFSTRKDSFDYAPYAGDVFASNVTNSVMQLGAGEPRLGVFVVDTQGDPRVMVGPMAQAFERVVKNGGGDQSSEASKLATSSYSAADSAALPTLPWNARFAAPMRAPSRSSSFVSITKGELSIESYEVLDKVTLEQVDAHGATLASGIVTITEAQRYRPVPVTMTPRPGAPTSAPAPASSAGGDAGKTRPAGSITFARLRYPDGAVLEVQLIDNDQREPPRN
jgi:hypothetical protein